MLNEKAGLCRGLIVAAAITVASGATLAGDWSSAGRDLKNSRYQSDERRISPGNVAGLTKKWEMTTEGDVTANPAVDGDFLYFPDSKNSINGSGGKLYKVNKHTGVVVWKRPISEYTGVPGDFARATPAVAGDLLILGNQAGKFLGPAFGQPVPSGAKAFAVNKHTGALVWMTQVDATAMSMITHSAIVVDGMALVGVASNEELIAGFVPKAYWQWNFRGNVVALDVATGVKKWTTYTVPPGYYGGSVWGSTGAVDRAHKLAYMATGNNFWVPQAAMDCLNGGGSPKACMAADNYFDSIIALDLSTGAIKWAGRGLPYDAFNVGCGLSIPGVFEVPPNDNCPNPKGPDWDFSQGPMLFGGNGTEGSESGNLVGAGQKSGMFWAFNAKTGKPAWSRQVSPPGLTGGMQWGSATDGKSIFVTAANSGLSGAGTTPLPWTLMDGSTTTAGGWAALDAQKGDLLWTTKDPAGSRAEAAVSGANGVIFGCNLAAVGTMYALDAKTGAPLWSYNSGGPCQAGPAIADGVVYWGSGNYQGYGPFKFFAFGL